MQLKSILCSGNYSTSRLEAFSDGVFAIVITLLVLNIHTPILKTVDSKHLLFALMALTPKIVIYIVSFINIAVYWINHHQLLSVLRKTDRGFLWLNCLLLLILVFIPFPTSVVGAYPGQFVSIAFFGVIMMLAAICFGTMRAYSVYYSCLIKCEAIDLQIVKRAMVKSYVGALLYLGAILCGLISTKISIALYFVIPLAYIFPEKLEREMRS